MPCTSRCHICFSLRAVRSNTVKLQDFRVDGWNPTNYLGWLEDVFMGHFGDTAGILLRFPGSTLVIHDSWFSDPWIAEVKDKVKIFCFLSANSMAALMGNHNRPEILEKTNLPWSAARNAVYHVASLVPPCASPLLLLWSVLVAPEIPANPSMTKWLDPTLKTPFPGDLYISTLTGPRLSVNFNLLFSLLQWQEMSANPKAGL